MSVDGGDYQAYGLGEALAAMTDWVAPRRAPVTVDCGFVGLHPEEKQRILDAANHALVLYPGPVGELLRREFIAWANFGYRIGDGALVRRAVNRVLHQWSRRENEEKSA